MRIGTAVSRETPVYGHRAHKTTRAPGYRPPPRRACPLVHPSTRTRRRRHPGCRAAGCPARSPSGSPGPTTAGRCDTPLDCIPAAPGHAVPQWAKTAPTTVCWGLGDPPRAPPDTRKGLSRASRPQFGRRTSPHPPSGKSIQSPHRVPRSSMTKRRYLRNSSDITPKSGPPRIERAASARHPSGTWSICPLGHQLIHPYRCLASPAHGTSVTF